MTFRTYLQYQKLRLRQAADDLEISTPHAGWLARGGKPSLTLAQKIIEWSAGSITLDDLVGGTEK